MSSVKADETFPSRTVSWSLCDFKEYPMGLFSEGGEANEGHLSLGSIIKGLMQLPADSLCTCYTKYFLLVLIARLQRQAIQGCWWVAQE